MVGKPKKVLLQYGPNGQSLGSAIVIFPRSDLAAKAASELNGVSIDKRPIRVEILLSAAAVPVIPQKTLAERVTSSKKSEKNKPKPATKPAGGRGRGNKRGRGTGGRNARGPKKTIEELDADMTDYWKDDGANGDAMATNGGGAVQATTGDTNMDDEML
ncbi:hypothetical protein BCR34DRAFT_593016 [Clohesyomyces aquaticus]|uniref:Chromatin target of PRMT1 protein C-terminal domain-containing protein n=1 Tax=Clohesyomyces aquaticus TaxID=1231657 RepID=A0A1Y1YM03_9PLEO|nr:hypothetical protein BCR34DRAFT_593016 [Clohesyomyces aquaticus]